MKAEIKCVACGVVMGEWGKFEFLDADFEFVRTSMVCDCGAIPDLRVILEDEPVEKEQQDEA